VMRSHFLQVDLYPISWHVVVSVPEDGEEEKEELDLPHSLRRLGQCTFYDVMHLNYLLGLSRPCH